MKVPNVESLFENELRDLHSAESQLIKALPKMAKAANHPDLKDAITAHLEETKGQLARLDKIGQMLDLKMTGIKCKAMEGLLEEGKEVFEMEAPDEVIDVAIIAAAQRVEHYEMSGYGTARALAEYLGHDKVVKLLSETLEQEEAADEKLTAICLDSILSSITNHDSDEDDDEVPARKLVKSR